MSSVSVESKYILGPDSIPFYTTQWIPQGKAGAHVLFVHGFAEHIARYDHFFRILAASPYALHITAFDQRGHGRTSQEPLKRDSPEALAWREQNKTVHFEKNAKRRTGGWAKIIPDIEWFVRYASAAAEKEEKALFLWGFSMGGAEVLNFSIKASKSVMALISGVMAGGSLIRLVKPAPWIQLKAGTLVANLGLGNLLIPAPLDCNQLSHNPESNEKYKNDPFCEPVGTTRGVADMINGGMVLDTRVSWDKFPKNIPLLLYHGSDDGICDVQGSKRFGQGVKDAGGDVTMHILDGMYHEVHDELEPTPTNLAKTIADWVLTHLSQSSAPVVAIAETATTVDEGGDDTTPGDIAAAEEGEESLKGSLGGAKL